MTPPETAVAVVMISIRIGKLVVVAVEPHPVNRAMLAAEGATGCEETLQPLGQSKRSMRQQSVVTNRHAKAGGHPIQDREGRHRLPAPEQWQEGDDRQGVDRDHESDRSPAFRRIESDRGMAFVGHMQPFCLVSKGVCPLWPAWWRWRRDRNGRHLA